MKDQYFGDVNDYRKYGLIRCLSEALDVRVGMLWLLTPNDMRRDGEFRRYLDEPQRWRAHDAPLYDALSQLKGDGVDRRVAHAATWNLIPGAAYFDAVIPDAGPDRTSLFQRAEAALAACPLVFVDPDNGLEIGSVRYGARGSSKYVFWRELQQLFGNGHSLLIYQHYPRKARDVFHLDTALAVRAKLGAARVMVFATAHVAFFLALQSTHEPQEERIASLVSQRWQGQIKMVDLVPSMADPAHEPPANSAF